jgi:tetratricopeptide (TPR) repeat protein
VAELFPRIAPRYAGASRPKHRIDKRVKAAATPPQSPRNGMTNLNRLTGLLARRKVLYSSCAVRREASMRQVPSLTGAAVALLITVAHVAAQERELPSEWLLCLNEAKAYTPDIVVSGCNAVIRLRDQTPREYAIAFNNRGLAYRSLDDTARAFADYGAAIERDPNYTSAFSNRGTAYVDIGDFDHAIADYSEALRIGPKSAVILTNRGIAQHDKGDLDRAIADYDEAIRTDPTYAGAFTHRGNA